ncbi:MAG: isopenicillin N synthase family oxygenase [Bacteroidetes bacterium]|nr:isopenicillin N synthase family oxygenase [Bacteroidota bacterium]
MTELPVIDLKDFLNQSKLSSKVATEIREACIQYGFFYIRNHGIDETLQEQLETISREFFALPLSEKMKIHMSLGGSAWRGYFPIGEELTSGQPDLKEGLYFGEELTADHPLVKAKTPLHGSNLFPNYPEALQTTVLNYIQAMTKLGHQLMEAVSLSLGLAPNYFNQNYTSHPFTLFRIFHYPATNSRQQWGVGEHTDYGVLTILKQDDIGGLQVKSNNLWVEAPPIPNTFVCNIGDMLERITGGLYLSTPHRVLNTSGKSRLSFPFFFDPNFKAKVATIPSLPKTSADYQRWDHKSVYDFEGNYEEYILEKVSKVFPELDRRVKKKED